MKLVNMPDCAYRNAVVNAATAVMADSADMGHMLQKANMLLQHDFPWPQEAKKKTEGTEKPKA